MAVVPISYQLPFSASHSANTHPLGNCTIHGTHFAHTQEGNTRIQHKSVTQESGQCLQDCPQPQQGVVGYWLSRSQSLVEAAGVDLSPRDNHPRPQMLLHFGFAALNFGRSFFQHNYKGNEKMAFTRKAYFTTDKKTR